MKKIISLLVISSMVIAGGLMVFADELVDKECLLSEEQINVMLDVKTAFLNEKVAEGFITQTQADEFLAALTSRDERQVLKDLGFGQWARNSEYAETLESIMPHKNLQSRSSEGNRRGKMLRVQP